MYRYGKEDASDASKMMMPSSELVRTVFYMVKDSSSTT